MPSRQERRRAAREAREALDKIAPANDRERLAHGIAVAIAGFGARGGELSEVTYALLRYGAQCAVSHGLDRDQWQSQCDAAWAAELADTKTASPKGDP